MCLIVVGWQIQPDTPLVVAANRDEFYARPTAAEGPWADAPGVIAGRDLEAGGTWLGITEAGRFAAVTNVREPGAPPGRITRGRLTRDFLCSGVAPEDYLRAIAGTDYAGFNLLVGDRESLHYLSNRADAPRRLAPGLYGVSNHLLDTPWPKLTTARERFKQALTSLPDREDFFALLADDEIVADAQLPDTGVPLAWERLLSAIFVRSENYGTRASTVLVRTAAGEITLEERSFGPLGQALGRVVQSSRISTGV